MGGLENAILLCAWVSKCHTFVWRDIENAILLYGGVSKCHFLYGGFRKSAKFYPSFPSLISKGIALTKNIRNYILIYAIHED